MGIIQAKLIESMRSILPIGAIVFLLSLTIAPMDTGTFLLFLVGLAFLIVGLSVFTMGVEMSMNTLGSRIGASLSNSKSAWFIAFIGFIIGILVTASEPDLQILAELVSGVPNLLLILIVSVGVGIFLVIALLRVRYGISLSVLLTVFYSIVFVLCIFVPSEFWALAFDSGGVTTGPMTVPFIMALGAGASGAKSRKHGSHDDSFGLVALCSIGPIISVLILGICASFGDMNYTPEPATVLADTREGALVYLGGLADAAKEVAIALLPILVFTALFQLISRPFSRRQVFRIGVGVAYVFFGLMFFLTGANTGLLPVGRSFGATLSGVLGGYVLIPVSMCLGYFIISAEPAVYVLNRQVEQVTAGAISSSTIRIALSVGVSAALGLSMLRVLTGMSILFILIPGYLIALVLSFIVPPFFTGIAFDSGGVASGTMMSAFVLPLAIGSCSALGGNIMTDAYGCVAFAAMTPIISIQICGLIYKLKANRAVRRFNNEDEYFIDYTKEEGGVNYAAP